MKVHIFVLLCIVPLKSVTGKRDQQVVQEQQKRSLTNKQLQIIFVYDEDLQQNQEFPKIESCYHEENGIYRKVHSEGSGIAPNQLLIILADSGKIPSAKCLNIHAVRVATHPSTGRPYMGVLNYCLPKEESIKIADDKLINLIKRELAHVLNDLMTPYPLESNRVSRITLAYFEDIKGQDIEPFCDIPKEPKCAGYENGIGGCYLYEHDKQLDEEYQYMDNLFPFTAKQKEKYGGHMAFDYCPVLLFQCSKNIGVQVIFNEKAFQCPVDGGPLHMEQQLRNGNASIDIQCPKCTSLCKVSLSDLQLFATSSVLTKMNKSCYCNNTDLDKKFVS
ncbi:unnamed protein product [Schistosoma margrebowiei]|uniref:Leishmanolysin-like peptidase n=1 Tax=Schistosoma margrebowiei TaxID=48269 RepID=A0AA85AEF3_9TREM|nr:unnamed protein product [Schistosoma margrebowiei]